MLHMSEAGIKGSTSYYTPDYLGDVTIVPALDTWFWHTGPQMNMGSNKDTTAN